MDEGRATPHECPDCGTHLAPSLLSCPSCHRLVHAERLKGLAARARQASDGADLGAALAAWREALELLPEGSSQADEVRRRISELTKRVDGSAAAPASARVLEAPPPGSLWSKWLAPLGIGGLLLWKFKFVIGFVLTKGKLLLVGLTKSSTALSMLLSLGVYWTAWGWRFAAGLVVSMYVHEIGHVAALQRYGIKATAPMFVPGLGAFVRMDQYPVDAREDARVGLAGPVWGLGAALASLAVYWVTGAPIWGGIARFGAWLNLFNLLPIWQLDGGRGFRALDKRQRIVFTLVCAAAWLATGEGLLALITIAAAFRAFSESAPAAGDRTTLLEFIALIVFLAPIATLNVSVTP